VPFGWWLDDQEASGASAPFAATLFFGSGPANGHRSVLSRLQSSLLTSISFMMSASPASGAAAASSSAAAISGSSSAGGVCAVATRIEAKLTPATSTGSRAQLIRRVEVIARPHSKSRQGCVYSGAKL